MCQLHNQLLSSQTRFDVPELDYFFRPNSRFIAKFLKGVLFILNDGFPVAEYLRINGSYSRCGRGAPPAGRGAGSQRLRRARLPGFSSVTARVTGPGMLIPWSRKASDAPLSPVTFYVGLFTGVSGTRLLATALPVAPSAARSSRSSDFCGLASLNLNSCCFSSSQTI